MISTILILSMLYCGIMVFSNSIFCNRKTSDFIWAIYNWGLSAIFMLNIMNVSTLLLADIFRVFSWILFVVGTIYWSICCFKDYAYDIAYLEAYKDYLKSLDNNGGGSHDE